MPRAPGQGPPRWGQQPRLPPGAARCARPAPARSSLGTLPGLRYGLGVARVPRAERAQRGAAAGAGGWNPQPQIPGAGWVSPRPRLCLRQGRDEWPFQFVLSCVRGEPVCWPAPEQKEPARGCSQGREEGLARAAPTGRVLPLLPRTRGTPHTLLAGPCEQMGTRRGHGWAARAALPAQLHGPGWMQGTQDGAEPGAGGGRDWLPVGARGSKPSAAKGGGGGVRRRSRAMGRSG